MLTKSESNETRIDVENRSTWIPNSRQSSSVNSRLLLRSKERTFLDESDSIAVRWPRTQHRKRPERSQWRIHCESWNLLVFFLGNGPFPRYFRNLRLALCFSFLERKCYRIQWGWRGQYGRWSMESLIPPIDPQPGSWWSNLNWKRFWCDWDCSSRWRWSLHSF